MKHAVVLRWVGALVAALPSLAMAAEADVSLSLSKAIDRALKNNPQVIAARHEAAAASARVTAARSGLLPQVYLAERFQRTNSPLWAFGTKLNQGVIQGSDFNPDALNEPDAINNFNTALSLSWRLYDGGQTRLGWDQAQKGESVANLGLERSRQKIIARVARAYVGLLLAGENLAVIDQSLDTSRAQFKLVEDRFRGGLAVKSDVLRAKVRIANLEQQRLAAGSQVQIARAMLYAAMGQEDAEPISTTTPFERCTPTKGELEQFVDMALDRRSDLEQLDLQTAIAEKEVARARAGHLPAVALEGNYEINSEDFSDSHDNYAVGAVVRLNLYSGRRISAKTAEARSRVAKARAARRSMALAVRLETQQAYYSAGSTWQSIAVAQQAVVQAEEGLRIVGNRYGNGLLTIVDLLDAQVALQQARTQRFTAMHDYKVARIELALATGTISRDFR